MTFILLLSRVLGDLIHSPVQDPRWLSTCLIRRISGAIGRGRLVIVWQFRFIPDRFWSAGYQQQQEQSYGKNGW